MNFNYDTVVLLVMKAVQMYMMSCSSNCKLLHLYIVCGSLNDVNNLVYELLLSKFNEEHLLQNLQLENGA